MKLISKFKGKIQIGVATKMKNKIGEFLQQKLFMFKNSYPMGFFLIFTNKETEKSFLEHKKYEQKSLSNLAFISLFLIIIFNWTNSSKDNTNQTPWFVTRLMLILILIFTYLITGRRLIEKSHCLMTGVVLTLILFNIKCNHSDYHSESLMFEGLQIELLLLILVITRSNWRKTSIVTILTNLAFTLVVYYKENVQLFSVLIFFFLNTIIISYSSYSSEYSSRRQFFEHMTKVNSLKNFKDLINESLLSPTIICQEDYSILFENKEALNLFSCGDKQELLDCFKTISMKRCEEEDRIELARKIILQERNNLLDKSFNLADVEDINYIHFKEEECSLYEALLMFSSLVKAKKHFHLNLSSVFQNKAKDTILNYDINVRKINWEGENAMMIHFTENKLAKKIHHFEEQAKFNDILFGSLRYDLSASLNRIVGNIKDSLAIVKDVAVRRDLKTGIFWSKLSLFTVDDLSDHQHLSYGKLQLKIEHFSLWNIIIEIAKLMRVQARISRVELNTENKIAGLNRDGRIYSDSQRVKQVLVRLLSNLLKLVQKGEITLTLLKEKSKADQNIKFLIKFSYRIDCQDCENEDPKNRINSKKYDPEKSFQAGELGLIAIQKILNAVNNNQQEIKTESTEGQGICISLELINHFEREPEGSHARILERRGLEAHKFIGSYNTIKDKILKENFLTLPVLPAHLKILIVDDDFINTLLISSYLDSEKPHIEYLIAYNGLEALKIIDRKSKENYFFDLILMDCNMPLMDGYETTKRIRSQIQLKLIPNLVIIATTTNISLSEYNACISSGMNDLISKPISKVDLFNKIMRSLSQKG